MFLYENLTRVPAALKVAKTQTLSAIGLESLALARRALGHKAIVLPPSSNPLTIEEYEQLQVEAVKITVSREDPFPKTASHNWCSSHQLWELEIETYFCSIRVLRGGKKVCLFHKITGEQFSDIKSLEDELRQTIAYREDPAPQNIINTFVSIMDNNEI